MSTLSIFDIRLANLRRIAAKYEEAPGLTLAGVLDYSPAFISQLIGKHPQRNIGEKLARKIEAKLKLAHGALDDPPFEEELA